MRCLALLVTVLGLLAACSAAFSAPAGVFGRDIPKVALSLNQATAQDAAAQVQKATSVQIATQQDEEGTITCDIKDLQIEAAIDAIAQAYKGSWMRCYMIEAEGPPQQPYTVEELLKFLKEYRHDYASRLPIEEQKKIGERFGGMANAVSGQREGGIGARLAKIGGQRPADQGAAMPQQQQASIMGDVAELLRTYDPLREVVSAAYKETIPLELKDATLERALDAIHAASGFIVLADEGLQATVNIPQQDLDVEQAIDKIATAAHAKWRRVYIMTKPQPQSEADLEKRMDEGFERALTDFWAKSPEDRAQLVAEIANRLQNLPPQMAAIAKSLPFASHIVGKLITYNAGLDAQHRQEIAPAVHAAIKLLGGG